MMIRTLNNSCFTTLILSLAAALSACASTTSTTTTTTTSTTMTTAARTATATPTPTGGRFARLNKELAAAMLIETHSIRADIEREYNNVSNRLGGDLSAATRERL